MPCPTYHTPMCAASTWRLASSLSDAGLWQHWGSLRIRGRLVREGRCVAPAELQSQLSALQTPTDLRQWLGNCSGSFALVYQSDQVCWAAVDIARSIPLFWQAYAGGEVALSDQLRVSDPGFRPLEPWWSGQWLGQVEYLPGDLTLDARFRQVQAGHFIWLRPDQGPLVDVYFSHERAAMASTDSPQVLGQQFMTVLDALIDRLIATADERPLTVLLSGGYDSRLLLAKLYERSYSGGLHALTYGQPGSFEHLRAQAITRKLGIPWVFVPYTPERLGAFFSPQWLDYAQYAANLSVLPQDQDFFALLYARQQELIPPNSFILPGYCADVQAGSYLPGRYFSYPGRLSQQALDRYISYRLNAHLTAESYQLLSSYLPSAYYPQPPANTNELISRLEAWFVRERMAKYIVNGVRAYEYLGYGWQLPFWDPDFIRFWQAVPNDLRVGMRLYRHTLAQQLFQPLGIHFKEDERPAPSAWKAWLKALPGTQVKKRLPHKAPPPDVNGFDWLNQQLRHTLNWPPDAPLIPINNMLGYWLQDHWRRNPR